MTADTDLTGHQEAITQLRGLIDQQASRLGEVAGLLEELFGLLHDIEGDLKAARSLPPPASARVIDLHPGGGPGLPSRAPSPPEGSEGS